MFDEVRIVRAKPQNLVLDPFAPTLGGGFEIYCARWNADEPVSNGPVSFGGQSMTFPWDGDKKTIYLIFTLQFSGYAGPANDVVVYLRPPSDFLLSTSASVYYEQGATKGECVAGTVATQLVTSYPNPMYVPLFTESPTGLSLDGPSVRAEGFDYSSGLAITLSITAMVATWSTDGCYSQEPVG